MCATGDCQRMISGTIFGISPGFCSSFLVLIGVFVQRQHAAGDRVSRGVVAADDQQHDIAQQLLWIHVVGGFVMRKHGNQVELRWLSFALLVVALEVSQTFEQLLETFVRVLELLRIAQILNRIGPVDQLETVFLGYVKQRCQHLSGQFHGHMADPVEFLVAWQTVQNRAGALTNQRLQIRQVSRREHGGDDFALVVVFRWVFLDEHG